MKIRIINTGKIVDAEMLEMNCARVNLDTGLSDYLESFEFDILPDTEDLKIEIRDVVEQQGWNDATVGILAGEFIAENYLGAQFLEFLREQDKEENEVCVFGG